MPAKESKELSFITKLVNLFNTLSAFRIGIISGRVTLKSSLRTFVNSSTTDGKVFTIVLYDGTGEISCSLFNPDWYSSIQVKQS